MRVLFLTHQYFPRHIGGTEMLVRGLARKLRERGHEAVVITYVESNSGYLPDYGFRVTEFEGVPVWELHWNLSVSPHPPEAEFHNPMIAELVARAAREIAPDVVHAAHLMKLSAAVVPRLKREGLPVIVSLSDFWPLCLRHTLLKPDATLCETGPDHPHRCLACAQATHGFAMPQDACGNETALLERAAHASADEDDPDAHFRSDVMALARRKDAVRDGLLQADRIMALSEFQRGVFLKHGYPPDRIEVLSHGVDTAPLEAGRTARRAPKEDTSHREIVFMGTLAVHKGPHVLIEAMRAAPDNRLSLQIFGAPGSEAGYVESLHQLAAGDPRITFCGVLPPERLGEAYANAAALALPALWFENDPLVVKGALYFGVPVAASRIGSLATQVHEPEDGWLLAPGDVSAWAAWLRLIADARTLPTPSGNGIATMEAYSREMFGAYEELAAKRGASHEV